MKQIVLFSAMLLQVLSLHAQDLEKNTDSRKKNRFKNSVQLSTGRFYINRSLPEHQRTSTVRFPAYNVSYTRAISPNWSIRLNYQSNWKRKNGGLRPFTYEADPSDSNSVGKIISRSEWRLADLEGGYAKRYKNHRLSLFAGPAWLQTGNTYVERLVIIYQPTTTPGVFRPHLMRNELSYKKEQYWGASFRLQYDYFFLKDRFNAGVDFTFKTYARVPYPYNFYLLHIGVNF